MTRTRLAPLHHTFAHSRIRTGTALGKHRWFGSGIIANSTAVAAAVQEAFSHGHSIVATILFKVPSTGAGRPDIFQKGQLHYRMHFGLTGSANTTGITSVAVEPWDAYFRGVFLTKQAAERYQAIFAKGEWPAHDNEEVLIRYQSDLRANIANLDTVANFAAVVTKCIALLALEHNWHVLPESIGALRVARSVAMGMHALVLHCRDLVLAIDRINELGEAERAELLAQSVKDICRQLEVVAASSVAQIGSLRDRIERVLAQLRNPELLARPESLKLQLQSLVGLLQWPSTRLAEGVMQAPAIQPFADARAQCSEAAEAPYSPREFEMAVPGLGTTKKQGGGYFGLFGAGTVTIEEDDTSSSPFYHGHERPCAEWFVINPVEVTGSVASPRAVQKEAVLLNYTVDTHLDGTIKNMLLEQCSRTPLARQPYNDCVRHLRNSMWMMETFSLSDRAVCRETFLRLAPHVTQDSLRDNPGAMISMSRQAGVNLHGKGHAFIGVDPPVASSLFQSFVWLAQSSGIERQDDVKCKIALAMIGAAPCYGNFIPHLYQVKFQELYFVSGRTRATFQRGLQFYIDLVMRHLVTLQKRCDGTRRIFSQVLIAGEAWPGMEVLTNGDEIRASLIAAVQNREDIIMRFHVLINEWRYVTVLKKLLFYFTSDDGQVAMRAKCTRTSPFMRLYCSPESNPPAKQNMELNAGEADSRDAVNDAQAELTAKIIQCQRDGKVFQAYKYLLYSTRIVAPTEEVHPHLPGLWRMFHSAAGQLNYLNCLNETLRELINDTLTYNTETPALQSYITRMMQGYASKVREVLARNICGTESTFMKAAIMDHLRSMWTHVGEEELIAISDTSINTLEHVSRTLRHLENEWASEIHQLGGRVTEALDFGPVLRDTYGCKMCTPT